MVVALVKKAALANVPTDPAIWMPALQVAQVMRAIAGEGTLNLVLLNAEHGVMVLADNVLQQTWIQAHCRHFQVTIVVSRGKHFVTYFRKNRLLSGSSEREGLVWLQALKAKRTLVEPVRHEEPRRTTRSAGQPQQHLVTYTNPNKMKLAIISTSPDQSQYENPALAWRRILQPKANALTTMSPSSVPVSNQIPNPTPTTRKRGQPRGSRNLCSKPIALRGVKIQRTEQNFTLSSCSHSDPSRSVGPESNLV